MCCAILHNLLLRQSHDEIEDLLYLLRSEGLEYVVLVEGRVVKIADVPPHDDHVVICDNEALAMARQKRADLGVLMSMRQ